MLHKLSIIGTSVTLALFASGFAHADSTIEVTNNEKDTQTITGYNITNKGACKAGGLNGVEQVFMSNVKRGNTQEETILFSGKLCLAAQATCSSYGCPSMKYGEVEGYSVEDNQTYKFIFENSKFIQQ